MTTKVWVDKNMIDLLESILLDAHGVNHLFGRHLKRLDILARMVGDGQVKTQKDVERIRAALLETAQILNSAKNCLTRSNRNLS